MYGEQEEMISVCIPSRGMMHSRTIDDVLENIAYLSEVVGFNFDADFIFSHGRPQPEAENHLVEEALKTRNDYIWFVDDDMAFPNKATLASLVECLTDTDVAVAHYPCSAGGNDAVHIRSGVFESAGMGCVLVNRGVFEKLERPYFRCDTQYMWNGEKLEPSPVPENHTPEKIHGMHDVDFFQRLIKVGIIPAVSPIKAGQYNLVDGSIKKYGNHTQQNVDTWML